MTAHRYRQIDDRFLDQKIKPRIIVFMADGTDLSPQRRTKKDESLFGRQGPNNVAININKFIAKYDFEIASKLKLQDKDAVSKD